MLSAPTLVFRGITKVPPKNAKTSPDVGEYLLDAPTKTLTQAISETANVIDRELVPSDLPSQE
jgi:hypothetical protein